MFTWGSHTRQQRSPQLKLEEAHALLPSSKPEGSHVPLSPMAAALVCTDRDSEMSLSCPSPLWLFFLEHPYLLLYPLFHPRPSQTKPVNPRTSQVRITQPFSSIPCSLEYPQSTATPLPTLTSKGRSCNRWVLYLSQQMNRHTRKCGL